MNISHNSLTQQYILIGLVKQSLFFVFVFFENLQRMNRFTNLFFLHINTNWKNDPKPPSVELASY